MKIVHLQHPYIPGRGYQENYLPACQKDLGHEVHIVTTNIVPDKFRTEINTGYDTGTFYYKNVPTHRLNSITYDTEAATFPIGAVRKIKNLNPDVVHSHRLISFLTISSMCAKLLTDTKVIHDLHIDNDNFHLDETYKKVGFEGFKHVLLPIIRYQADGFIAVNPHAKQFLQQRLHISNPTLLPLGVDTTKFQPSRQEGKSIREDLGIDMDEFVIITAGNLNESKKIDEILKSIPKVDADAFRLIILGSGSDEYLNSLHKLVKENGISDKVLFQDFVPHDELSKYYNAADIGIWPGKLGITIIEAISCGLPVIVEDSPATEILISNNNGVGLTTVSSSYLASEINRYIKYPDIRRNHAKNAIQLACSELSWTKIAKKSIAYYRKVLDKNSSRVL